MASNSQRFWKCCILLAVIGCQQSSPVDIAASPESGAVLEHDAGVAEKIQEKEKEPEADSRTKLPVGPPLGNLPQIVESKISTLKVGNSSKEIADVTVKNAGDSILIYPGRVSFDGVTWVPQILETEEDGTWTQPRVEWDCRPTTEFEIRPNETAQFRVEFRVRSSDPAKKQRILAYFAEKGTSRVGRIVVATKP